MTRPFVSTALTPPIFTKETLIKGQPRQIRCLDLLGHTFVVKGRVITTVGLEDDWYDDVQDPEVVVRALRALPNPPDLLTFWQRMPDVEPRHAYHTEFVDIAVLPIQNYDHWWKNQIKSRVRNQIRKSEKEGLVVREVAFDDEFVRGMTAIFNESPVRQGRPFWHYGKNFETVKAQFSRYLHRERMIGAYYEGELAGFIMLGNAGRFGLTGQIISSLKHRDKSPNNALIAKAVELCAEQGLGHLIYLFWSDDSLAEFKRRCGFEHVRVPRYWVPLTLKGRVALALGLHRGWKAVIPAALQARLKALRRHWYARSSE
jgi:hypothetical protein